MTNVNYRYGKMEFESIKIFQTIIFCIHFRIIILSTFYLIIMKTIISAGCGSRNDCYNLGIGDHQYCQDCHNYLTCAPSGVFVRPCPANLEFDNNLQACVGRSFTCRRAVGWGGVRFGWRQCTCWILQCFTYMYRYTYLFYLWKTCALLCSLGL